MQTLNESIFASIAYTLHKYFSEFSSQSLPLAKQKTSIGVCERSSEKDLLSGELSGAFADLPTNIFRASQSPENSSKQFSTSLQVGVLKLKYKRYSQQCGSTSTIFV